MVHPAIGERAIPVVIERGVMIGRLAGEVDVDLSWDPKVAARHGRFFVSGGKLWFEDFGSEHGSWYGGTRIRAPMQVTAGVWLRLGDTIVYAPESGGPVAAPKQELGGATAPITEAQRDTLPAPEAEPKPEPKRLREHPRFVTHQEVEVQIADRDELKKLWLRDISKGGLFVETETPPPLHQRLEVRIRIGEDTLALSAAVVHIMDPATAAKLGMAAGAGLQFVDLSAEHRRAIEAYVEGLAARLGSAPSKPDAAAAGVSPEVLRDVKRIIDQFEANQLYKALDVSPEIADSELVRRMKDLHAALERARQQSAGPHAVRIEAAVHILERIQTAFSDPQRRLEYDFRNGQVRAQARLQQAQAGTGPNLAALKRAWHAAMPAQVARATFLTRMALAARQRGDIEEAILAGRRALEANPFIEDLIASIAAWEKLSKSRF